MVLFYHHVFSIKLLCRIIERLTVRSLYPGAASSDAQQPLVPDPLRTTSVGSRLRAVFQMEDLLGS
ncbi:MAG: hypothetical protein WCT49_02195 [Candidatus Paceibacterota bacterium]|nr:hypothetical protein [Candidatus Paceibacterota bacterium]